MVFRRMDYAKNEAGRGDFGTVAGGRNNDGVWGMRRGVLPDQSWERADFQLACCQTAGSGKNVPDYKHGLPSAIIHIVQGGSVKFRKKLFWENQDAIA